MNKNDEIFLTLYDIDQKKAIVPGLDYNESS